MRARKRGHDIAITNFQYITAQNKSNNIKIIHGIFLQRIALLAWPATPQAPPDSPSWQDLDVGGERARLDDPAVALGEELPPERHVVPEGGVHEPRVLRHVRHRHFAGERGQEC